MTYHGFPFIIKAHCNLFSSISMYFYCSKTSPTKQNHVFIMAYFIFLLKKLLHLRKNS